MLNAKCYQMLKRLICLFIDSRLFRISEGAMEPQIVTLSTVMWQAYDPMSTHLVPLKNA